MYSFSKKSLDRLAQCHPDLQELAHEVIREMDITILEGHRGEKEQNDAFNRGTSKLRWPNSKHNQLPSHALDAAPFPIDWGDIARFRQMCKLFEAAALRLNINIRLGRDFSFRDYPHIELVFADKKAKRLP